MSDKPSPLSEKSIFNSLPSQLEEYLNSLAPHFEEFDNKLSKTTEKLRRLKLLINGLPIAPTEIVNPLKPNVDL